MSKAYKKTGKIITVGGREFRDEETRYTIMEQELLAFAEGLEKNKIYIARAPKTVVRCDNKCALAHINRTCLPASDRALRFLLKIQQFRNIQAEYINTKDNGAADTLSRGLLRDKTENSVLAIKGGPRLRNFLSVFSAQIGQAVIRRVDMEKIWQNFYFSS